MYIITLSGSIALHMGITVPNLSSYINNYVEAKYFIDARLLLIEEI